MALSDLEFVCFEGTEETFVQCARARMLLDRNDCLRLSAFGVWEPYSTEVVTSLLSKGDICVDMGANIGYYTLLFARQVGDEGCVFAFEPDPENFKILESNIMRNGYRNVVIVPMAVSDKTGETNFYISADKGDGRIYDSSDGRPFLTVKTTSLDDYFKSFRRSINLIKMDIQGAELRALYGMRNLVAANHVKLMTEFWPTGIRKSGFEGSDYLRELRSLNFEITEINEEMKRIEPVVDSQLLENYAEEETNLLCLPLGAPDVRVFGA